jgi:hypothetical protein
MTTRIRSRSESVIDSWSTIIENAGGQEKKLMDDMARVIGEAHIPYARLSRDDCTTGFSGTKRDFLILRHDYYSQYRMFIGAKEYGTSLDVSWFLTLYINRLRARMLKIATGNPHAFSMQLDIFQQQDVRAFVSIAHHCVKHAVEALCGELEQTPVGLNTQSKGFLSVW